jgi:hypothetical protein
LSTASLQRKTIAGPIALVSGRMSERLALGGKEVLSRQRKRFEKRKEREEGMRRLRPQAGRRNR